MKEFIRTFLLGLFVTALLVWNVWGLVIIGSAVGLTIEMVIGGLYIIMMIFGVGIVTRELTKDRY